MSERVSWVDIAKSIFIIAIVIGHVFFYGESNVRWYVYSFHVPAFFFLSGYCCRFKYDFNGFLRNRFYRLMVPFFSLSVVFIVLFAIATKYIPSIRAVFSFDLKQSIKTLLYANYNKYPMKYNLPLWFLPCLFCVEIMAFCVDALGSKISHIWGSRIIACFLSVLLGIVFKENLPWHFETAAAMLIWFEIGVMARETNIIERVYVNRRLVIILAAILIIFGGYISFRNWTNVSVVRNLYGKYHIYYLSSFCSILGYVLLSRGINKNALLEYIGQNTMSILAFHKPTIVFFQYIFKPTQSLLNAPDSVPGFLFGMAVCALSIAICLIVAKFVDLFFPFFLGKRHHKKRAS